MKENDEKRKALDAAMGQIEKQFGKGSVMKLGEYKAMEVEAIPTGSLTLDVALGILTFEMPSFCLGGISFLDDYINLRYCLW